MVSLHWTNRPQRSAIASIWAFQVAMGASVIAHAKIDMPWMIRYYGLR